MRLTRLSVAGVRLVRSLGGVAFLAAAVWTVVAFARDFDTVPGPWSSQPGMLAVAWNTLWFALFAFHHSLFARAATKAWASRWVSPLLERSVYVWVSSALLALVVWQWVPVPGQAWRASGLANAGLTGLQVAGVALTVLAIRQLDVGSFAGMRPARGATELQRTGLYGVVRHPIYFAWLLMVWPTATMTGSRLTFAVLTTIYLVVAVPLEERSLRREFGTAYDGYRRAVRWRMLPGVY